MRARLLCIAVIASGACSSNDGTYDYANSKGAALYQEMCQVCHGEAGEGGLGPVLRDSKRTYGALERAIADRMPANAPGQCTGECASELAQFIREGLTSSALACNAVPPSARRLRLLTRREYRATVRDLFGTGAPAMSCARASDCAYRDTCSAGQCEPTACDAQTFVFDPQGRTYASVHVAGDWNAWASTISGGGLPLSYDAATSLWVGTFTIGTGRHLYKLVLDEQTWISDPRAPASEADGFGGQNSLVELACSPDPVASLPVESRRAGFPFDTDSAAALVTSAHVDAYLAAAEKLADFAATSQMDVKAIGRRLFRRPLTTDEVTRYTALAAMDARTALHAMLVSPSFLYRSELGEKSGDHYRLTPYEIATALSYGFLGTTPSDELLDAAERGELAKPAGIEKWARALLDDPHARAQVGELVLQWSGAQNVLTAEKRADLFPDFNAATRSALAAETRAFAEHVVFDGAGTFGELMTASYTIVDPIAAKFYGFSGAGRVTYDGSRAGLLGHASILATTAHSDQTSPVLRGLLVRRNFLCQELPPPPPFAGGLPAVDPNATTRDRFDMHSKTPSCRACHQYIDSIGAGLERFDPVGRWRDSENGKSIAAGGDMNDVERLGTETSAQFQTLPELAQTLATSAAAQSCFVRQYLRFSRGVRETLAERCARLKLEEKLDAAGGNIRELMIQSVLSPDFVERR